MMDKLVQKIIGYVLYTFFLCVIFYFIAVPKIVEHRAQELGFLTYNSKIDKMVEKDTLVISGWELYYLKKGKMEGYQGY